MTKFLLLVLLFAAPAAIAQCTIQPAGSPLVPPVDDWTAEQPIGFAFPFAGATWTGLYISDHSLVALTNAGTPVAPPGGAFLWSPDVANLVVGGPLIVPYWSDHRPGPTGSMTIDNTSGTSCTITWFDHQTYLNLPPPFSLQLTLHLDGRIQMRLDDRIDNQGSTFGALNAVIGLSAGAPALLPPPSDLSADPSSLDPTVYQEWVTSAPATPNPQFDMAGREIWFLPNGTGWTVFDLPLGCAMKQVDGVGCDGLALDSNLPIVGANWDLTTTGVASVSPLVATFFAAGAQVFPLPLTSIGIDAPGCLVYLDVFHVFGGLTAPAAGGSALLIAAVPGSPGLVGTIVYTQSVALTTSNPAGIATSNGLQGLVGY